MNHRADEVHTDLLSATGTEDVSPELLAFLDGPRVAALIHRDDELGDGSQDLEEFGFCSFPAFSKQQKILIAMSS